MTTEGKGGRNDLTSANRQRTLAANLKKARELWARGWIAYPAERLESMTPHIGDEDRIVSTGPRMAEHLSQVDPCDGCLWCDGYVAALADLLKLHRMAVEVE